MYRKLLFTVCLLFAVNIACQAQDINFYKSIAGTLGKNVQRLKALDSVISKTYKINSDEFVYYSMQYIELAKDLDFIEDAAKKAIQLQPILTSEKNNAKEAVKIINGVLIHKYKIKNTKILGGLYLSRGRANASIDLREAIADYSNAINNYSAKDSLQIANTLLYRGQANSNLGRFVPAAEDFRNSYLYFVQEKKYAQMMQAQRGNITMFSLNGFYEKAKKERDELIAELKLLGLNKYLASAYYGQALDYEKMGNYKLEFESLKIAEKHLEMAPNDFQTFVGVHGMLAEYYCKIDDLDNAKKNIDIIEKLKERFDGNPFASLNYQKTMAVYQKKMGAYDIALRYAKNRLQNAKNLGVEDEIMNSHQLLSDIYSASGNYKESLENKTEYIAIKDSLYSRSNANTLAYFQTLYETEKKERELVEKNTNIQLLENDNDNFKRVVFFISLAIVCLFGLLLLYRNQRNLRDNKLVQEKYSQELLVSQELERMRISKDLHDGIGQQLLVLKNMLIMSGNDDAKQMVDSTIDEIRTISRDLHPFQLQELGITKAIEHTLNQIDENTSLFISSDIDNIDNIFNKQQEVNIYRIVQESLSNILKHSKAEASKISVKRFSNKVNIIIVDNGTGFDFQEKFQDIKSLGLKTLLERTKFLNGHMKIQSKINEGTLVEFQFPTV